MVAVQILDVLEHLHDRGYAHSDIKAENLMIGQCTYERSKYDFSRLDHVAEDLAAIKAQREAEASDVDNNDDDDGTKAKTPRSKKSNSSSGIDSDYDENEKDVKTEEATDDEDANSEILSAHKELYFTPPSVVGNNRVKTPNTVEFSGSNPMRSCRMARKNSIYEDMLNTHYLRPCRKVSYFYDDEDQEENDDKKDRNFRFSGGSSSKRSPQKATEDNNKSIASAANFVTEDRIFVIDFGLAIKFIDSSGTHRPFCMDQRRAHDGTLEFTSRDAHMGAHSRRSDLECLGYNLIYWLKGSLPWKDEKLMQQPEQVHRMKEYFMTDIQVMFKHIYGSDVPLFVGQFMEYVGGLAYHDRPDYQLCRCIFAAEMQRLGCDPRTDMSFSMAELRKRPRKTAKGAENNNSAAIKFKDAKSMMKLGLMIPFKESASNRISPKNLRSKSEKLHKKQKVKFSWTDILSTDPDQIARQRAEKEFERDQNDTPLVCRYRGKPTYAILEMEKRLKFKDKLDAQISEVDEPSNDPEESCSSLASSSSGQSEANSSQQLKTSSTRRTKTVPRRNQHNEKGRGRISSSPNNPKVQFGGMDKQHSHSRYTNKDEDESVDQVPELRRKNGLRRKIRPTEKSLSYQQSVAAKRQTPQKKQQQPQPTRSKRNMIPSSEFSASEESSSCSSNVQTNSVVDEEISSSSSGCERFALRRGSIAPRYNSSCGMSSRASDDEQEENDGDEEDDDDGEEEDQDDADDDDEDLTTHFSPIKTRRIRRIAAFKRKASSIPISDRCK